MALTKTLERMAREYLPPWAARAAKRVAVHPRYWSQRAACRRGFREHADKYPQKVLFVAGLPKSGTTWLEKMISSYPGFHDLLIPDVAAHELRTGGSHDYELPDGMFDRFDGLLALTKMHVHGSAHNAEVLRKAGVRYVVLYRDLRDVAISHFYYVLQTPWHAEYPVYRGMDLETGLEKFAERTLPEYAEWVRLWESNRDPERSVALRYEDMLSDAVGAMTRVAQLFELDSSRETVERIVEENSFKRLSAGRDQGQASEKSFFRKGVAGDWQNQFTPRLREVYKGVIGEFLIETGYERDLSW